MQQKARERPVTPKLVQTVEESPVHSSAALLGAGWCRVNQKNKNECLQRTPGLAKVDTLFSYIKSAIKELNADLKAASHPGEPDEAQHVNLMKHSM